MIILWLLFGLFFVSSVVSQIMYELRLFSDFKTHDDNKLTALIEKWKSKEYETHNNANSADAKNRAAD